MDVFQMNKEVMKFLFISFVLTQTLLQCCSSTLVYDGVRFGDVSCDYSGISLDIILESNFEGIIYSQGNFLNPTCSYYPPLEYVSVFNISFFLPLTDCGTVIRELDGAIFISNIVVVQKHRLVETVSDVVRQVSCQLPYPNSLKSEEVRTYGNNSSRYKNNVLESWMDFQTRSGTLGKAVSNKLLVGDEFLMIIHLKDGGVNKALQVESCWAYDGETINKSLYILNIYDKFACGLSDWVSEFNLTKGINNASDSMTYAVVKAFKFPMTKIVHIACSVQVCTNSCWDFCKVPESQRSNLYQRMWKRSVPDDFSEKSLRERYKLMKATVKALGVKLIESNKARMSGQNLDFHRRISNSESTATQDFEVDTTSVDNDNYDKGHDKASTISQSLWPKDSSDSYGTESEYYPNDVYVFNLTNNIVVFTDHEFNFKHEYVTPPIELQTNNVSKLKFSTVTASLCFISFSLLLACVSLALYLRRERRRNKIDSFLLYRFY